MQIILDETIDSEMLRRKMMPTAKQLTNVLLEIFWSRKPETTKNIIHDYHNCIYRINNYHIWEFKTLAELDDYITSYLDDVIIHSLKVEYFCNIIIDAVHNGLLCYCYYDEEYNCQDVFVSRKFVKEKNNPLLKLALNYIGIEYSDDIDNENDQSMTANEVERWINNYRSPINTVEINKWVKKILNGINKMI